VAGPVPSGKVPVVEITLATPALLFPAVSLLMLAYTNRFLGLASLIRSLHVNYEKSKDRAVARQIRNLRRRLGFIRRMQTLGVLSLFACVACMFTLFAGQQLAGKALFGLSLLLLMASLGLSVAEIHISTEALKIQLSAMEEDPDAKL
jgi:hypothetical protein